MPDPEKYQPGQTHMTGGISCPRPQAGDLLHRMRLDGADFRWVVSAIA